MAPANLFSHKGLRVHPSVQRVMVRHSGLDPETEKTLLLAAQSGDLWSRQKLINHNLALICKVGGTYRNEQTDNSLLDDDVLLNQGVIGLHRAIDKWRPDGGARLTTFAAWDIRSAMQSDDCLYADETIRIPKSTRTQLKKINEVEAQHNEPVSVEGLAAQAEIGLQRVNLLLQVHQPFSLNIPTDTDGEELIDLISDPQTEEPCAMQELLLSLPLNIAGLIREGRWRQVLALIPSKLAEVVRLRFWGESTFKTISHQLSIPLNNVSAVLAEGIEALRLQILGRRSLIPYLDLSIPGVVGSKLLTRGLGCGVQVIKQTKHIVQEAVGNPVIDRLYPIRIQILLPASNEQASKVKTLQPQVFFKRPEAVPDQLLPATQ